jgi:hypothetical protein
MLNLEGLAHLSYSKDERSMNHETLADRAYVLTGNFVDPFAVP